MHEVVEFFIEMKGNHTSVLIFSILSLFAGINVHAQDINDKVIIGNKIEFAEPIFHDNATDVGGEAGEFEFSIMSGILKLKGNNFFQTSVETEYTITESFGVELELPVLYKKPGIPDTEFGIETQYTFLLKNNHALAGGFELGFPMGKGESGIEIEPYLTFVLKPLANLFCSANLNAAFEAGEEEDDKIQLGYNGAVIYKLKNLFGGVELNYDAQIAKTSFLSPQVGFETGDFTIGMGAQLPLKGSASIPRYYLMGRLIYEWELLD